MAKANHKSRLGRWLTESGVTYEELAEQLGVTPPAVLHYVAGRNRPSAETLLKLSEITGIPPGELLASIVREVV